MKAYPETGIVLLVLSPTMFQAYGLRKHWIFVTCLSILYRNYGLESPRLLKRGMKSRSLFIWGLGDGSASRTSRLSVALSLKIALDGLTADIACCGEKRGSGPQRRQGAPTGRRSVAGFLIGWIAAQFLPSSACSERMFC
jgi:hypothetical protein